MVRLGFPGANRSALKSVYASKEWAHGGPGIVAPSHAHAACAPAQAGTTAGARCAARIVPGVDDADASSHALRRFCKPAAGVCVLGGRLRVRFGPAGGAALHTRMGSESRKCARPPVETIAQDLRLSPADAGA